MTSKTMPAQAEDLLKKAKQGVEQYLDQQHKAGEIADNYYQDAVKNVIPNLREWYTDPEIDRISPNLKGGIEDAVNQGRWEDIVNAYVREIKFGTGGIRGLMAFDRDSILKLKKEGLDARILKGPNTMNNVVVLLKSVGVARYANDKGLHRIVIGFDTRIRGQDIGNLIAKLFLAYGLQVHVFDAPCPYPELTFAVPSVKADIGILISASHNDYRYNGYKLSCGNGSQFDVSERNIIYEQYIRSSTTKQIKLMEFADAPKDKLIYLSGEDREDYDGHGHRSIDMHSRHIRHVQQFVLRGDMIRSMKDPLRIGYSAFHGAGRAAFPRILQGVGFQPPMVIQALNEPDGIFPSFCNDPGKEQQPDPGDPRAAEIAIRAFQKEYPGKFENLDILIGTDPDADRCGVVVKVPPDQRRIYDGKDHYLLMADEAWAVLLWYRMAYEIEKYGKIRDVEKKFIVESHTSSDLLYKIAMKYNLGFIKTWVGFAMISNAIRMVWDGKDLPDVKEGRVHPGDELCHPVLYGWEGMNTGKRSINVCASEQSNGFSLLGGPPPDARSLGEGGHVRDKDGTIAGLLMAEVAAYAKTQGTNLFQLLDEKVYLDPDIGLFVSFYEPDPLDGEYPGLKGDSHKREILVKADELHTRTQAGKPASFAGVEATGSFIYRTGKYDAQNYKGFPDEGIRFYFDRDSHMNWLHIRPSGTSNSLRFHVQFWDPRVTRDTLANRKAELQALARRVVEDVREKLGAPL